MGMDVYGLTPRSKVGEYFQRSVWSWHPLADYARRFSAAQHGEGWHFNDGYGLTDEQARQLATQMTDDISSGRAKEYVEQRTKRLTRMSNVDCHICGGTGRKKAPPQIGAGDHICNACHGEGKFALENVPMYLV